MSSHATLHWYFDEEARRREELLPAGLDAPALRWTTRRRQRLMRLFIGLALAFVLVSLGREYLVWEDARMRTVIRRSVEREASAWHRLEYAAISESLDPDAREDWVQWHNQYQQGWRKWADVDARLPRVEIGAVDFLGRGRALVEVRLRTPEVPDVEAYRQYRLYRNLAGEWLRTSTEETLWGEVEEQRVGIFHFVYRSQDRGAVDAVAAEVDAIWRGLHSRVGLHRGPEDPSLHIVVQGENVGGGPARFHGDRLRLLSPKLSRTRLSDSEGQALSRMVSAALARLVLDRFMERRRFDPQWALTYEAALAWLAEEANPLLPGDPRLETGALGKWISQSGLPRLDDLLERRTTSYYWWAGWAPTAAHTLIAYAMNTYGADRFNDLIVGLTRAEDWEGLTQSVFGVSAPEFEAGWHAYLRWRYGLE